MFSYIPACDILFDCEREVTDIVILRVDDCINSV